MTDLALDIADPERPPAIVAVGSVNRDHTVLVDHAPFPGETVIGTTSYQSPGGKGGNQSVAAARLGGSVSMVAAVGRDGIGDQLRAALLAEGIDIDYVVVIDGAVSGQAFISVAPDGESTILVDPGANALLSLEHIWAARHRIESCDALLLQLEVPLAPVRAAAELARGCVILNPAPARELDRELLALVSVLVPNRVELARLTGAPVPTDIDTVARLARTVKGPAAVVVTLGADGALVVDGDRVVAVAAESVTAVDATGAGDCFCAALADGLVRGMHLEAATRWACRSAAVATTRRGAQASLPYRGELPPWQGLNI